MYQNKGLALGLLIFCAPVSAAPNLLPYVENSFNTRVLSVKSEVASWTENKAYRFQESLDRAIQVRGQRQIGYKLALTAKRAPFGALKPVYGRIYDFNLLGSGAEISLQSFQHPLVELELAYKFTRSFLPPFTMEKLQGAISYVAPAVELPDLTFDKPKKVSWQDFVISGASTRKVIIGTPTRLRNVDINNIFAQARWDGQLYTRGYSNNVMGDQWKALLYLAKQLNKRGYHIKSGDWVLTGAMNAMLPLRAGRYSVNYGVLGDVSFMVKKAVKGEIKTTPALYIDGKPITSLQ